MASNVIPRGYDPLVELLEDAADGAHQHQVAIGLKQNMEAGIRVDLEALVGKPTVDGDDPTPGLKALWNVAKANKTAKTAALRTAESNGRALATTCINTLKPVLGSQWNSNWNAAGFTGGSLSVPVSPMTMLQQFRAYYSAHPGREVANVNGIACTAAGCETAAQAISSAQSESNQSNTDAGTAQSNLETGIANARRRLTGLREEISQLIDDDDERWYAFGFDKPSDPSLPEIPENLVITAGPTGHLIVDWDDARRAERYRIWRLIAESDADFVPVATVNDSETTLEGLESGRTVRIRVTAANDAGESQPSDEVETVVP